MLGSTPFPGLFITENTKPNFAMLGARGLVDNGAYLRNLGWDSEYIHNLGVSNCSQTMFVAMICSFVPQFLHDQGISPTMARNPEFILIESPLNALLQPVGLYTPP